MMVQDKREVKQEMLDDFAKLDKHDFIARWGVDIFEKLNWNEIELKTEIEITTLRDAP